ncbi:TPA: nuclear transport factor 2 family protein, partial [Vibrio cholerae O1]
LHFAEGKVTYHRDYFDMGEMLYEQLPVLGQVIRAIKRRLGQ